MNFSFHEAVHIEIFLGDPHCGDRIKVQDTQVTFTNSNQPPYSPHLALDDFLFGSLKKHLADCQFKPDFESTDEKRGKTAVKGHKAPPLKKQ
jgi:hypothetical protein